MSCELIGWCALSSSAQAAWVQAIGSILAVGAAILVAWFQAKDAREQATADRQRQATIVATSLALAFEGLKLEAEMRLSHLLPLTPVISGYDATANVQRDKLFEALQLDTSSLAAAEQQALLFDESVGKVVVMAAVTAKNFNRKLRGRLLQSSSKAWHPQELRDFHDDLIASLRRVIRTSEQVVPILNLLHGMTRPSDAESQGNPA